MTPLDRVEQWAKGLLEVEEKATPGPWERIGASRVWKTGSDGGAVVLAVEPRCEDSGDFMEVDIGSQRWGEAMENVALIIAVRNSVRASAQGWLDICAAVRECRSCKNSLVSPCIYCATYHAVLSRLAEGLGKGEK